MKLITKKVLQPVSVQLTFMELYELMLDASSLGDINLTIGDYDIILSLYEDEVVFDKSNMTVTITPTEEGYEDTFIKRRGAET